MYILKQVEQKVLLKRLILTDTLDGGWTRIFIDPISNVGWFLFFHHPEMQGGGLPVLRENPPPKQLSDWLRVCFLSSNDDDIRGLAWELSSEYEQWPDILDWLVANFATISAMQTKLFIENLEILHTRNRRPIVGKTVEEIDKDYRFFMSLAQRARGLI
jgi:hypothetical protein